MTKNYMLVWFDLYTESVRRRSSAQKDVNYSNVTVETKDGYVVSLCEELSRIYLGDVEDPNNSSELSPLSPTHVHVPTRSVEPCTCTSLYNIDQDVVA